MAWGYLNEFWNAVQEVVVNSGTYSVDWFQSLGNAVAGAIGGLFNDLIHHIYDVFYFLWWFVSNIGSILQVGLTPVSWIYNFFNGFYTASTSSLAQLGITVNEITVYSEQVEGFINAIPYFNMVVAGVGGALGLFFFFAIMKQLRHG